MQVGSTLSSRCLLVFAFAGIHLTALLAESSLSYMMLLLTPLSCSCLDNPSGCPHVPMVLGSRGLSLRYGGSTPSRMHPRILAYFTYFAYFAYLRISRISRIYAYLRVFRVSAYPGISGISGISRIRVFRVVAHVSAILTSICGSTLITITSRTTPTRLIPNPAPLREMALPPQMGSTHRTDANH